MKKRVSDIIWGAILITIGVLIIGKSLGFINFNIFFPGWWTLFIIVPSTVSLITENHKTESILMLIFGILPLLASREVLEFKTVFKIYLCAFLIFLGIRLIIPKPKKVHTKIKDNLPTYNSIFGSFNEKYAEDKFEGCQTISIFGDATIDLRDVTLKEDCTIKALSVFGGTKLIMPDNVNVVVTGFSVFGDCNNHKRNTEKNKYTIYIDQTSIFGSIEIN